MHKLITDLLPECFINKYRSFIHRTNPNRRRSLGRRGWNSSPRVKDITVNDDDRIALEHSNSNFDDLIEKEFSEHEQTIELLIAHTNASAQPNSHPGSCIGNQVIPGLRGLIRVQALLLFL
jgi:hypothetical protein